MVNCGRGTEVVDSGMESMVCRVNMVVRILIELAIEGFVLVVS